MIEVVNKQDEHNPVRVITTFPRERWEGHWVSGRKYPLYSVVENNGTKFMSLTGKMKEEPYVLYDQETETFYANDGWVIKEMSADSRISALGGNGGGDGFASVTARVDGDPAKVVVTVGGEPGAKTLDFAFSDIKGQKGDTGATGATGLTGPRGVPGPAGVDSVKVNVSNTSGTPSGAAAVNNGLLSLSFAGIKGEQGNTGSSVDYPFELVNNRTTNDATKALTAAEGKRIGDDLYNIEEDVRGGAVIKQLTWQDGFIAEGGGVYAETYKNTKYTQPFLLRRGERISINTTSNGIATISRTTQDSISVGDLLTTIRTITTGDPQEVNHSYLATQDLNVVICVNKEDSTVNIEKTDSVYTRLGAIEPVVGMLDKGVNLTLGNVFNNLGSANGYYTAGETSHQKIFTSTPYVKHIEIPIYPSLESVKLSGFTYIPSTADQAVYTRILYFDAEDNLLDSISSINDVENNTMLLKKPADATQCYVDVPTVHANEVIVQINPETMSDDFKKKIRLTMGDTISAFNPRTGYYTYQTVSGVKVKNYIATNQVSHIEIPVDSSLVSVRLSGFTYTPSSANQSVYTRIIFYDSEDKYITHINKFTDPQKTEIFLKKPSNATQCYVDVPTVHAREVVVQINSNSSGETDPYNKYIPYVANLAYKKDSTPLVLLHFSDIHGSTDNYGRIEDFANKMGSNIDDIISTGDNVYNSWADSFSYWTNETILNTIGNHDTAKYAVGGDPAYDWTYYAGKDAYDRYFAPFIENWGVTQPEGADENGYCYYYKDYTTQGIRLIVLDVMSWQKEENESVTTQHDWLVSALTSAITAGLSVVIAIHYQFDGAGVTPLNTGFNSYIGWGTGSNTYTPATAISAVDDFITGGGKFICWIAGHTHRDLVGYLSEHHNQLCIVVGTDASDASNLSYGDSARVSGTDSQDLFNAIAFDATQHQIRIVRIGCNINKQLQPRNTLVLGYSPNGSSAPTVIRES